MIEGEPQRKAAGGKCRSGGALAAHLSFAVAPPGAARPPLRWGRWQSLQSLNRQSSLDLAQTVSKRLRCSIGIGADPEA